MAGSDMLWRCRVNADLTGEVSLFKVTFSNALHLLEDIADFEVRSCLEEGTLADIVNLLEIKNAMQDAFRFVESLIRDIAAFFVQVAVELLKIHERDLGRLLNLAHNLFSEIVKMLLGVHELLKINHRVKIADDK